jgi:hypothetical protein
MKRTLLRLAIIAGAVLIMSSSSCLEIDHPEPEIPLITIGTYILNSGNFGSNDANLIAYNPYNKELNYNIFERSNGGKKLGDTAQDMIAFGSKIYIAVYNSGLIFVTDLEGKVIKEIKTKAQGSSANLSPRYFTTWENCVYVTFYEGYAGKIDTTSLTVSALSKVGDNPEQIKIAGEKLYVANSGGMNYPNYGKTLSVLNPVTMDVMSEVTVADNPIYLEADSKGFLYVVSMGNYNDVPSCLQIVNTNNESVQKLELEGITPSFIAKGPGNALYLVSSSYDANWNLIADYYIFDTSKKEIYGKLIQDGTRIENPYSLSADTLLTLIYIGTSDYTTNGQMYVIDAFGHMYHAFDTGGLNPITACPVTAGGPKDN